MIHLLVVILAMPAHAAPPRRRPIPQGANAKPKPKSDMRERLAQTLVKPVLPFVDPNGQLSEFQPNPGTNPLIQQTLANAVGAGKAIEQNTFQKNTPNINTPNLGGKGGAAAGGSGAFNYNSAGGNGDGSGGGEGGGGNNGGGRGREGRGSQSGGAKAFGLWYPMCLFVGNHVSTQAGNAAVKGLIDQAAKCEVNLVVFPVTTKNIPNSADAVNSAQVSSCNITDAFGSLGVDRASTSTCAPYDRIAGEMCKDPDPASPNGQGPPWNPAVKGCAVLAEGSLENVRRQLRKLFGNTPEEERKFQERMKDVEKHMGGGTGKGVLPSIEETNSCNAGIVGHEALGHSMWGHPNGKSDGNGIGISREDEDSGGGDMNGWTDEGCTAMRGKAFNNDGRWKYDPNRQNYYTKIEDPAAQWDLMGGGQLFKQPPPAPPPGGPPPKRNGGPQNITYDENAGGGKNPGVRTLGREGSNLAQSPPPASPPSAPANNDFTPILDSKHKRKNKNTAVATLDSPGTPPAPKSVANDDAPIPQTVPAAPLPPPGGKGGSPQSITYDESAPKGRTGGDSGNSGIMRPSIPSPPPSSGDGGSMSLTYDESAPKNGSSAGGGGRTSITYNEGAAKNGSSIGSQVLRMGSAVGEAPPSTPPGEALPSASGAGGSLSAGIGSIKLSPGGFSGGSMSNDFFKESAGGGGNEDDEKKEERRRRMRVDGAGGERRRGPASLNQNSRRGSP